MLCDSSRDSDSSPVFDDSDSSPFFFTLTRTLTRTQKSCSGMHVFWHLWLMKTTKYDKSIKRIIWSIGINEGGKNILFVFMFWKIKKYWICGLLDSWLGLEKKNSLGLEDSDSEVMTRTRTRTWRWRLGLRLRGDDSDSDSDLTIWTRTQHWRCPETLILFTLTFNVMTTFHNVRYLTLT